MRKLLICLILFVSVNGLIAQNVPEFKLKEMSYGMKNMKKLPKKIYISLNKDQNKYGIRNMKDRAAEVGFELSIFSSEKGTTIEIKKQA